MSCTVFFSTKFTYITESISDLGIIIVAAADDVGPVGDHLRAEDSFT
jgi:hypothetical protein